MKKIKIFILWLFVCWLWLTSFSNASYDFIYKDHLDINLNYTNSSLSFPTNTLYYKTFSELWIDNWDYVCLSWFFTTNNHYPNTNLEMSYYTYLGANPLSNNAPFMYLNTRTRNTAVNDQGHFECLFNNNYYSSYASNNKYFIIAPVSWCSYSNGCNIVWQYDIYVLKSVSWWSNDCSSCESTLEALSGAYSTLSWYYSTCQSNLSSCQSWLSWYIECQWNLVSCEDDNESLSNMNQSLSDQLQQCLVNWWNWCDPEVDTWCVDWSKVYSLFWNQMWSDFSLPITNNLFLLSGMRAYSDSWVVSLWYIETPSIDYSMDSDSWNRLISLVVWIFTILSWVVFILVAWYYLKKFLSYVLFPFKK